MKYLVTARLKPGKAGILLEKIDRETLGTGSAAFGEYVENMRLARRLDDGTVCWIETCFCGVPLQEERPYWAVYFEKIRIAEAVDPGQCLDATGRKARACLVCECAETAQNALNGQGTPFAAWLRRSVRRGTEAGERA